jgi:hypothetical protein
LRSPAPWRFQTALDPIEKPERLFARKQPADTVTGHKRRPFGVQLVTFGAIAASRSATLLNTPRRMVWRVISANSRSTRLRRPAKPPRPGCSRRDQQTKNLNSRLSTHRRMPLWLGAEIKAGKDREDFLVA